LQDSAVKALLVNAMTDVERRIAPSTQSFKTKLQAYLAAHPDVAKRMNLPSTN
jgi:hypothetical protein